VTYVIFENVDIFGGLVDYVVPDLVVPTFQNFFSMSLTTNQNKLKRLPLTIFFVPSIFATTFSHRNKPKNIFKFLLQK